MKAEQEKLFLLFFLTRAPNYTRHLFVCPQMVLNKHQVGLVINFFFFLQKHSSENRRASRGSWRLPYKTPLQTDPGWAPPGLPSPGIKKIWLVQRHFTLTTIQRDSASATREPLPCRGHQRSEPAAAATVGWDSAFFPPRHGNRSPAFATGPASVTLNPTSVHPPLLLFVSP